MWKNNVLVFDLAELYLIAKYVFGPNPDYGLVVCDVRIESLSEETVINFITNQPRIYVVIT